MSTIEPNRRQFLQNSGLAVATATAVGIALAGIHPREAWALTPKALPQDTAQGLLKMSRTLYPHAALGDVYYAKVVEALDTGAATDPSFAKILIDGMAELGAPHGGAFAELAPDIQLKAVKGIEGSAFFEVVRSTTAWTLYANPEVWGLFNYEGPSAEFGGYINRGFNDISWLPAD